ncbi:MAG TPA: hypothetical protein PKK58_10930, partial [Opitutaceae bacterium]|nr:hypothetical protein [Opitutaceae bacterium]
LSPRNRLDIFFLNCAVSKLGDKIKAIRAENNSRPETTDCSRKTKHGKARIKPHEGNRSAVEIRHCRCTNGAGKEDNRYPLWRTKF